MSFRCERTVTDLGGLEGNNHVGGRTQHCQVSSDGCGERHLQPVVGAGVWESSGKHLYDGDVRCNVRQDSDDHDEPIHTGTFSHLIGTTSHTQVEEGLGNTSIIEGSDEKELSNEQHQQAVIDFCQSSFGFRDQFFLLRLDFVTVHVVCLLDGKRVALGVVLGVVRTRVEVLALVGGDDHQDGTGGDRNDADVEPKCEEDKEDNNDEDLDL
mmetsp:Transcript_53643/g.130691  ORF Transcript_53643/g.130691 Transcript_53643/m.130691 type:complete len:211 (+) Transcript_53643:395-1027(+)